MSIDELAKIIPVRPPTVNRKTNPIAHIKVGVRFKFLPCRVAIQLKIFTPVGTAIIIVAAVKYARVSTSIPTVNMWCAHTIKPRRPMAIMA
jgi:hypothetical protein